MKVIVAITGASGLIYARQCLEVLASHPAVERVALILSDHAEDVMRAEGVELPVSERIERFDNDDMWASVASGSARWDAMLVVPASMGTVARVASGISRTLIERAADVMLKEGLPLIVVPREVPFNTIHLRNLCELGNAGATICPAAPSFYNNPSNIEELCSSVTERIIRLLGLKSNQLPWGNR